MTLFGFVIGTTLVNSLFLFDMLVTKYQQRLSSWGATMAVVLKMNSECNLIPYYTLIGLWVFGLIFGNDASFVQLVLCIVFWSWYIVLYVMSTVLYYKWDIPNMKDNNDT